MKHISLRPDSWNSERRRYLLTFLLGFGTLLLVFLPVIIADGGYFIYYGDFNSQQIPFYNLANDAVRSGSFGWNWYTDLGANFIGSYAFYLFGSPFFWITTILPRSWVTFSIPILLCIKHGVAALTAYAYIRRFVQNSNAAIVGGLLYAFSGFQLFKGKDYSFAINGQTGKQSGTPPLSWAKALLFSSALGVVVLIIFLLLGGGIFR